MSFLSVLDWTGAGIHDPAPPAQLGPYSAEFMAVGPEDQRARSS